MSRSFFVSGNIVRFIANADGADLRYRASPHIVAPRAMVPARINEHGETVVIVERGTLEVMVGGATQYLSAGSHVRVPRGIPFGYRNVGDEPACLLSRSLAPARAVRRVTIEIAAAG